MCRSTCLICVFLYCFPQFVCFIDNCNRLLRDLFWWVHLPSLANKLNAQPHPSNSASGTYYLSEGNHHDVVRTVGYDSPKMMMRDFILCLSLHAACAYENNHGCVCVLEFLIMVTARSDFSHISLEGRKSWTPFSQEEIQTHSTHLVLGRCNIVTGGRSFCLHFERQQRSILSIFCWLYSCIQASQLN